MVSKHSVKDRDKFVIVKLYDRSTIQAESQRKEKAIDIGVMAVRKTLAGRPFWDFVFVYKNDLFDETLKVRKLHKWGKEKQSKGVTDIKVQAIELYGSWENE